MDDGELIAGWRVEQLGILCEVIAGQSPQGKFYNDTGTGTPFYQGKKEFGDKFIGEPKKWTSHITKMACLDDILMSVRAPVGPINFATQNLCIGRGLAAIRTGVKIDKDFLYYQLLSKQSEISGNEGAVFASINKTQIESIELNLPPLPEQKRIVAILDEAFSGISLAVTNAEKNLANARELFESYLNNVFTQENDGWAVNTLKEVSIDFGRGKSKHRPRNAPHLYGGNYPFIQTGNIRNCEHLIEEYSQTYNEAGLAQSKLWSKGTICITIAANIAETGILNFDACFPDSVIGIVVDEKITSNKFVEYLLQAMKTRLKAKGKGSAQDNINLGTFEKEYFPFPPLDEQQQIAYRLSKLSEKVQQLETIYQQKLIALNELKQSILQKAFTGELSQRQENV